MIYTAKADKRNTSNGKTPNKAIRQPSNKPPKKNIGRGR